MKQTEQRDVVVKPPSPQAWKLAYQLIVSTILPRMIQGETGGKEKSSERGPY